jgi:hypothetical protein
MVISQIILIREVYWQSELYDPTDYFTVSQWIIKYYYLGCDVTGLKKRNWMDICKDIGTL